MPVKALDQKLRLGEMLTMGLTSYQSRHPLQLGDALVELRVG